MKVGNIVSQNKIDVSEDFNVVKSLDEIIQGLPTLIIGWDYIKKHYPDYDIINRKLGTDLFWTFKKTEKRDFHEEDLYNFIESTYKNLVKEIDYVFIDPILSKKKWLLKIIRKLYSSDNLIGYKYNNMVYLYNEDIIYGIDLTLIEFIGLSIKKLTDKLKKNICIFLVSELIFIEYKKRIEYLDNQVKFIPYLYSLENG